jgi:hypothetical protein
MISVRLAADGCGWARARILSLDTGQSEEDGKENGGALHFCLLFEWHRIIMKKRFKCAERETQEKTVITWME